MKVLLYATANSPRLQYACDFIFKEMMGIGYSITTSLQEFINSKDAKLNYSLYADESSFTLTPVRLLFEKSIAPQTIECFEINGHTAFYKTAPCDFPFDIFAASFYLLSRYEEYLPHQKDIYGRYGHENSLAFKQGFLHLPLINIWVKHFAAALQIKFPMLAVTWPAFKFIPTYDIDIAYSYKHKGFVRNLGGFIKSPSFNRLKVICGFKKDPFDTYKKLDFLHQKFQLKPVYFFLLAASRTRFDKNIAPGTKAMVALVQQHAKKYTTGIHPSWQSGNGTAILKSEISRLQTLTGSPVNISRQHYIRFNLPEGYQRLLSAGITAEYSMGYGSINGFRASTANAFWWFNLKKNEVSNLRVHPFCFMEANALYEQHLTPDEAFKEMLQYLKICKKTNGALITIWHNHMIGTDKLYHGWGKMYEAFLQEI